MSLQLIKKGDVPDQGSDVGGLLLDCASVFLYRLSSATGIIPPRFDKTSDTMARSRSPDMQTSYFRPTSILCMRSLTSRLPHGNIHGGICNLSN